MSRKLAAALVLWAVLAVRVRADPILLAEIDGSSGFGNLEGEYIPPENRWVQPTLRWGGNPPVLFGQGLQWYEPDLPGEHMWPDAGTAPEDWARFAAGLTNGTCENVDTGCLSGVWNGYHHVYFCDPDLAGWQIEYLRLRLDATWDPDPPEVSFSCAATWEIWGTPEPGGLPLLLLAVALAGSLRHRSLTISRSCPSRAALGCWRWAG